MHDIACSVISCPFLSCLFVPGLILPCPVLSSISLSNIYYYLDREMPKFNKSCQCVPGHKPFEPDARTGLIEGCAPLTSADKGTVSGCSRRFSIQDKAEWVPETVFPLQHDEQRGADVGVFFVSLGTFIETLLPKLFSLKNLSFYSRFFYRTGL